MLPKISISKQPSFLKLISKSLGLDKKYLRVSEFYFRDQNFRQNKWNGRIKNSLEREERVVRGLLARADSWLAEVEDPMR